MQSIIKSGIKVYIAKDKKSGFDFANKILQKKVDKTAALFLSGGKTPKELYTQIAKARKLHPGAVGMVDERFGFKMHKNSNEKMLAETGLFRYLKKTGVPFYSILQGHPASRFSEGFFLKGVSLFRDTPSKTPSKRKETGRRYEEQLRTLFAGFRKHIAVLGIGVDGHTAGIPAFKGYSLKGVSLQELQEDKLVYDYDDKGGFYKERITMTFTALSMMDLLLILVFGKEKNHALDLMFSEGSEEEIPARFFKRPEIAKKTILITDQKL